MKTRDIKELLILLRDFFPKNINTIYNSGSICYAIADMKGADILTAGEYSMLGDYIENHRPDETKSNGAFWWPYGELEPRMEFLNKLISEL